MSTAIFKSNNFQKLTWVFVLAVFVGCQGSEFSNRKDSNSVQYYGSTPTIATVRWQEANSEVLNSLCENQLIEELSLVTLTRDGSPILERLAQLEKLKTLRIIEVPLVDDELKAIVEVGQITELELSRTGISGCGLMHIAKLPIKKLTIRESEISQVGLDAIASMTDLEELELWVPNLHLADMPSLSSNCKLDSVTIAAGHFSYRRYGGLKCLVGATSIRELHLSGTNLNDRSMESISTLTALQNLTIDKCEVSDEGIDRLAGLENLRAVSISGYDRLPHQSIIRLAESTDEPTVPRPIRS